MNLSCAVFARHLRANERTLENWERGRSKLNAQAALVIQLAERFPETFRQLAAIERCATTRQDLTQMGKRCGCTDGFASGRPRRFS